MTYNVRSMVRPVNAPSSTKVITLLIKIRVSSSGRAVNASEDITANVGENDTDLIAGKDRQKVNNSKCVIVEQQKEMVVKVKMHQNI